MTFTVKRPLILSILYCQVSNDLYSQVSNDLYCQVSNDLYCQVSNDLYSQATNDLFHRAIKLTSKNNQVSHYTLVTDVTQ